MNLNKRPITLLTATLVAAAAAAVFFLSTPQIAQAQVLTLEEAIELLNTSADTVEEFDQSGADALRDAAALLGGDDGGPPCPNCG